MKHSKPLGPDGTVTYSLLKRLRRQAEERQRARWEDSEAARHESDDDES
jgi:hypothetical protein